MKRLKFVLSFISISVVLVGCGSKHLQNVWLPNGGARPKYPNFSESHKSFRLPNDSIIKTDILYVHEETGKKGTLYSFVRFFRTGQVYLGHNIDHFPTPADYDHFDSRNGQIGYFKASGSKSDPYISINMEVYFPMYGDNYHNITAFFENKNLRISHLELGEPLFIFFGPPVHREDVNRIYQPYEKVTLTNQPDW